MGETRNVQKRESVDIKRSGNMEERWKSYNNNFKSCFPHVEPLIFKGSKLFTTTVLLPYYYRIFGLLSICFAGGFFSNLDRVDGFPHVADLGIRKPSGFAEGFCKVCSLFLTCSCCRSVSASCWSWPFSFHPRHGRTIEEKAQNDICVFLL